jgi:tryptophan synthase beta chain
MHSLGHTFVPPPIHAGGLRYHGMSPTVSQLVEEELVTPRTVNQLSCYEAGSLFAKTEGFIPAPETTHALALAIAEARLAKEEGKEKVIVVNFSGHGLLDLGAYERYLAGNLQDVTLSDDEIEKLISVIKGNPVPARLKST